MKVDVDESAIASASSLEALKAMADCCRNCALWRNATQTVFGEGPADARILVVGEQPGNQEDLGGRPFVGPAGRMLDNAFAEAGINRSEAWVTNAVKHFKWKAHGKIRLHQKPSTGEISACRPWLMAELHKISPQVLVILGATAARSLLGPGIRVTEQRGVVKAPDLAERVILTVHPSSILRIRDVAERDQAFQGFVRDLSLAKAKPRRSKSR